MSPKQARGPGQSVLLLLEATEILTQLKIDYAVIGALAATQYGTIRSTVDADALVAVPASRLPKLAKAIKGAGFEVELRRGDADDPIPALLAVGDEFGNRVDLLAGLRGLDPEAFGRCVPVLYRGTKLRFIGREDFIAMKCFAGGPQDLADARQALATGGEPLDIDLLRRITRRFGRPAADNLERLLTRPRTD